MTAIVASSGQRTYPTGSGTATYTFADAGATAIVVFIQHDKGGEPSMSVSWGNKALTKVAVEAPGVSSSTGPAVQAWVLDDVSGRDDDVVRVSYSSSFPNDSGGNWFAYQLDDAAYDAVVSEHDWSWSANRVLANGAAGVCTVLGIGNVANYSGLQNLTELEQWDVRGQNAIGSKESAAAGEVAGILASSLVAGDSLAILVSFVPVPTDIEPAALGMEWGVVSPGPSIEVSVDVTNYASRLGMEWGVVLPGPKVRGGGRRQFMLTGSGIETPEMTTGGAPGQAPTFDAQGNLVWMDVGGGGADGSLFIDLDVSGAHLIDRDDGATHDLTLTGDATFTLAGAAADEATDIRLILRQDDTGGWTVTWPGSVVWAGGTEPVLQTDPAAVDTIGLLTVDDGTTWFGYHATSGGSGTPATTVTDETTWGITPAVGSDTEYARQDHTHGTPDTPSGGMGPLLISDDHSTPIVFADLLLTEDGDDLLYADTGG